MKFTRVCELLAARRCYESGMSVRELAKQAKRSQRTVKRWLELAGVNPAQPERSKP